MFNKKVIVRTPPLIEDAQIIRCLAAEIDGIPVFEAVLTVIQSHREELIDAVPGVVSDFGKLAWTNGGTSALDYLRLDLLARRTQGRKDS